MILNNEFKLLLVYSDRPRKYLDIIHSKQAYDVYVDSLYLSCFQQDVTIRARLHHKFQQRKVALIHVLYNDTLGENQGAGLTRTLNERVDARSQGTKSVKSRVPE